MGGEQQPWTQVGISCLLHNSVEVEKIRAGRSNPGLRKRLVVYCISQLNFRKTGRSIRTQVGISCLRHKSVEVETIWAGRSKPGLR